MRVTRKKTHRKFTAEQYQIAIARASLRPHQLTDDDLAALRTFSVSAAEQAERARAAARTRMSSCRHDGTEAR